MLSLGTIHSLFVDKHCLWGVLSSEKSLFLGSAYNQAGRSSGLTAPNGPAQTALVKNALTVAQKQPGDLNFVSLHGTGTPLGDPIETGALGPALSGSSMAMNHPITLGTSKPVSWPFAIYDVKACPIMAMLSCKKLSSPVEYSVLFWSRIQSRQAFRLQTIPKQPLTSRIHYCEYPGSVLWNLDRIEKITKCKPFSLGCGLRKSTIATIMAQSLNVIVGSVKACYGHTEGAAGLHGALCVFLSLKHQITPPIMHLRSMNPYVSAALADWQTSTGLYASVPRVSSSSFARTFTL